MSQTEDNAYDARGRHSLITNYSYYQDEVSIYIGGNGVA